MARFWSVADVFRPHGEAFAGTWAGISDYVERRVMAPHHGCREGGASAVTSRCDNCGAYTIAYNSVPQPPLSQVSGAGTAKWLAHRQAELMPVP